LDSRLRGQANNMLSDQERAAIDAVIARYPSRQAASIDCLVSLQQSRGWLSDEALADLAPVLGLGVHELDALATFYNRLYRRPVGRHVITVCDSVTCWIMGGEGLFDALRDQLGVGPGETTVDGRFTLLPTQCLGGCDRAPVLAIDDEQHPDLAAEELDPDRLRTLLARYD
jgi:NADH-quinone oxidoreductase subunit E